MVEAFKALSDLTRLKILTLVSGREMCVCELTEVLGVTSSCISQHLSKLKSAGLVLERRDAQWVFYTADLNAVKVLSGKLGAFGLEPLSDIEGMEAESAKFSALADNPRIKLCKSGE